MQPHYIDGCAKTKEFEEATHSRLTGQRLMMRSWSLCAVAVLSSVGEGKMVVNTWAGPFTAATSSGNQCAEQLPQSTASLLRTASSRTTMTSSDENATLFHLLQVYMSTSISYEVSLLSLRCVSEYLS